MLVNKQSYVSSGRSRMEVSCRVVSCRIVSCRVVARRVDKTFDGALRLRHVTRKSNITSS